MQYGPVFGLAVGGFGEVNDNMDVLVSRCATRAAESKWRLMGANSLAEAKQTFKARIRRSIGVEGARGGGSPAFALPTSCMACVHYDPTLRLRPLRPRLQEGRYGR